MHPDSELLAGVPLFAGLSDDERAQLASCFDVEEFEPGKQLAREGRHGYAFYILDEGRVRVEQDGRAIDELGPGDVFGEIAFFTDGRRTASVVAETPVRVLTMFGTRFREMQVSMPEVAQRLEDLVRKRSERVTDGQPEGV